MYRCPLCQSPLTLDERSYRCVNNHCFDVAKEGYVNLLLVQDKKSRQPGDNQAMVRARRDFLAQGYYQGLSNTLNAMVLEWLDKTGDCAPKNILDLGCGEGYYTHRLASMLCDERQRQDITLWGLDISKEAIRLAAKGDRRIHYSVASSYKLPFADHSMDMLLRIYAPGSEAECWRVLKASGVLITVTPGSTHLQGLKALIYAEPQRHRMEAVPDGFALLGRASLSELMRLDDTAAIHNLLMMTPYYYNLDPETQARVEALLSLETPIDFCLSVYAKVATA